MSWKTLQFCNCYAKVRAANNYSTLVCEWRVSIKCREAITKQITSLTSLSIHKGERRQFSEPIKNIQANTYGRRQARENVCERVGFLLLIG